MLSDQQSELMSAFLDGEQSRRERKLALRLLRRSSEARALLKRLQEAALGLRQLTPRKLPADFPQQVVNTIRARGLKPARPEILPFRPRAIPAWLGAAVAAAVLVLVASGSYLFFAALNPSAQPNELVTTPNTPNTPNQDEPAPKAPNPLVFELAQGTSEFFRPTEVRLRLPEIRQAAAKKQLNEELKRETSFQVEVSVKGNGKAVSRLETAMQKRGIQVFMDPAVKKRLSAPMPKEAVTYVLYTENMRPDEVTGLLEQLGQEDKAAKYQAVGNIVLAPMTTDQRSEMSKLLGVKVKDLAPPPKEGRIDLPMPVAMDPEDIKKGPANPKAKTPPAPDRFAVVLAVTPGANPAASGAVRNFLKSRRPQQPGTLQVVVVLNEATL
jgi:negative regulator of sigma E activity